MRYESMAGDGVQLSKKEKDEKARRMWKGIRRRSGKT